MRYGAAIQALRLFAFAVLAVLASTEFSPCTSAPLLPDLTVEFRMESGLSPQNFQSIAVFLEENEFVFSKDLVDGGGKSNLSLLMTNIFGLKQDKTIIYIQSSPINGGNFIASIYSSPGEAKDIKLEKALLSLITDRLKAIIITTSTYSNNASAIETFQQTYRAFNKHLK